jgi:hypothetical protein
MRSGAKLGLFTKNIFDDCRGVLRGAGALSGAER